MGLGCARNEELHVPSAVLGQQERIRRGGGGGGFKGCDPLTSCPTCKCTLFF